MSKYISTFLKYCTAQEVLLTGFLHYTIRIVRNLDTMRTTVGMTQSVDSVLELVITTKAAVNALPNVQIAVKIILQIQTNALSGKRKRKLLV